MPAAMWRRISRLMLEVCDRLHAGLTAKWFAAFLQCEATRLARFCRERMGRACLLCPGISDVDLFCYREGIIHLNAKVSDGAFDLGVAEQELHSP